MTDSRRITLKHVAETAGVDVSTASRALDTARVHLLKPETVRRVQGAAQRLGYHGNTMAGSLRRGRTNLIGVVIADFQNPFIAPVLRGLEHGLEALGIIPLVAESEDSSERLQSVVKALLSRQPDAILLTGARRGDQPFIEQIAAQVPVVLAVRTLASAKLPAVAHDDRQGGALAAQHLLDLGHRDIAQLAGPADASSFADRSAGFKRRLHQAGIRPLHITESARAPGVEAGLRLMHRALKVATTRPTAVFAQTDLMAVGALDAIREAGLRCPDDISIIGYNDIPLTDHVDPPLTTIRLPSYQLGRLAAELVAASVAADTAGTARLTLPPELVVRRSTAQLQELSATAWNALDSAG